MLRHAAGVTCKYADWVANNNPTASGVTLERTLNAYP